MVSLEVFGQHRNIGIQKQQRRPVSSTQRKSLTKEFPKLAWILAPKVARIWRGFFGAGKEGVTKFVTKFVAKTCDKIRASFR